MSVDDYLVYPRIHMPAYHKTRANNKFRTCKVDYCRHEVSGPKSVELLAAHHMIRHPELPVPLWISVGLEH